MGAYVPETVIILDDAVKAQIHDVDFGEDSVVQPYSLIEAVADEDPAPEIFYEVVQPE